MLKFTFQKITKTSIKNINHLIISFNFLCLLTDVMAAVTKEEFLFWTLNVLVSKANPVPADW